MVEMSSVRRRLLKPQTSHHYFNLKSPGDENMIGEHSYKYLTVDEMKSLGDDSMPIDVTHDEKQHKDSQGQIVRIF